MKKEVQAEIITPPIGEREDYGLGPFTISGHAVDEKDIVEAMMTLEEGWGDTLGEYFHSVKGEEQPRNFGQWLDDLKQKREPLVHASDMRYGTVTVDGIKDRRVVLDTSGLEKFPSTYTIDVLSGLFDRPPKEGETYQVIYTTTAEGKLGNKLLLFKLVDE